VSYQSRLGIVESAFRISERTLAKIAQEVKAHEHVVHGLHERQLKIEDRLATCMLLLESTEKELAELSANETDGVDKISAGHESKELHGLYLSLLSMEEALRSKRLSLEDADARMRTVEAKKTSIWREIKSKSSCLADLDLAYASRVLRIDQLNGEILELGDEYRVVKETHDQLGGELVRLRAELDSQTQMHIVKTREMIDAERRVDEFEGEVRELMTKKDQVVVQHELLVSESKAKSKRVSSLESELHHLMCKSDSRRKKVDLALERLETENTRLTLLQDDNAKKETQVAEAESVLARCEKSAFDREQEIKKSKQAVLDATIESERLKRVEADLEVEIKGVTLHMRGLPSQLKQHLQTLEKLQSEEASYDSKIDLWKYKIDTTCGIVNSEAERDVLTSELKDLESKFVESQMINSRLATELKRQLIDLKGAKRELSKIITQRDKLNSELSVLEEDVGLIERSCDSEKSSLETLLVTRDALVADVNAKRDLLESCVGVLLAKDGELVHIKESIARDQSEFNSKLEETKAEVKELAVQRRSLVLHLADEKLHIQNLKSRYGDVLDTGSEPPDNVVDTYRSMVIRADELTGEVDRATEELHALRRAKCSLDGSEIDEGYIETNLVDQWRNILASMTEAQKQRAEMYLLARTREIWNKTCSGLPEDIATNLRIA
jgi:chromosome segregation ATPase